MDFGSKSEPSLSIEDLVLGARYTFDCTVGADSPQTTLASRQVRCAHFSYRAVDTDARLLSAMRRFRLDNRSARHALDCGGFVFLGTLQRFEVTARGTRSQGTLCTFAVKARLAGTDDGTTRIEMPCGPAFATKIGRQFVTTVVRGRAPWTVLGQDEYVPVPAGQESTVLLANQGLDDQPAGSCEQAPF